MEKSAIYFLFVVFIGVCAPPTRETGCRKPLPKVILNVRHDNLIDLTQDFDENSYYWPNNPSGFVLKTLFAGFVNRTVPGFVNKTIEYFYDTKFYNQPEHLGTHMDAPSHFAETGISAEKVEMSKMIARGALINLKQNGERFPHDSLIEIKDILKWERSNGRIRSGSIVLLYTGYSDVYDDRAAYYGTNETGPESVSLLRFPGLGPEAAKWLITNRCIAAVGIDTASIDYAQSTTYESHRILNGANITIFENVGKLREIDERGSSFKVIALPQKIVGGTGAPLRILAVLD